MMYPYMTMGDGTVIVHSNLIEENGTKKVYVHFERPTENGFDDARCVLPEYRWTEIEGFTPDEIDKFLVLLKSNAHLLFRFASQGGIQIA